ncbi:MAG: polyphenol oxidase family protein [Deltaproteobacteria bacterium]|nr:polyphenol oxidase family protein [Deltaproteobacteria bacterium]
MLKKENLGVPYYVFSLLERHPSLRHAVLTRHGPDGSDWTFSHTPDSDLPTVLQNRRRAEAALGLPPAAWIKMTHGDRCLVLDPDSDYASDSMVEAQSDFDAIIGFPGQSLTVRLADCQGAILFDPVSRLLAMVHSGWRSSVKNILGQTVNLMKNDFGIKPENILAAFAPSLGPCCAEFINFKTELPASFTQFLTNKPFHFDFPAISRQQLLEVGLDPEHIEFSNICTKCSPEFYSYRRGDSGRFAILAGVIR